MNIIRRGNDDAEMAAPVAKAQVTCGQCGSLLMVTQKEIQEDDCGAFHHSDADAFCICGVCTHIIPIRTSSLKWQK